MKTYSVYYQSVNVGYITVQATSPEDAEKKADELIESGKGEIKWDECEECSVVGIY